MYICMNMFIKTMKLFIRKGTDSTSSGQEKKYNLKRKCDLQNVCHLGMSSIINNVTIGTMNNGTIMNNGIY